MGGPGGRSSARCSCCSCCGGRAGSGDGSMSAGDRLWSRPKLCDPVMASSRKGSVSSYWEDVVVDGVTGARWEDVVVDGVTGASCWVGWLRRASADSYMDDAAFSVGYTVWRSFVGVCKLLLGSSRERRRDRGCLEDGGCGVAGYDVMGGRRGRSGLSNSLKSWSVCGDIGYESVEDVGETFSSLPWVILEELDSGGC